VKGIAGDCNVWKLFMDALSSRRRSWNEVKGIAGDCNAWKLFMDALCSRRRSWN